MRQTFCHTALGWANYRLLSIFFFFFPKDLSWAINLNKEAEKTHAQKCAGAFSYNKDQSPPRLKLYCLTHEICSPRQR